MTTKDALPERASEMLCLALEQRTAGGLDVVLEALEREERIKNLV